MATDSEAQAHDPVLISAHHLSTPASTVATPLGTLSTLPPELRDEIYKLLCSDAYYSISVHPKFLNLKIPKRRQRTPRRLPELGMTVLSKSIRQEYLAVLHAEAIFTMPESQLFLGRDLTRVDVPFVDQIQKVEISDYPDDLVRCDYLCYNEGINIHEANEKLLEKEAKSFSLFIGTGIPRNVCVVRLVIETPKIILITQSPLFDAIRRLTEFQTLTLEIDGPEFHSDFYYYFSGALSVMAESMKNALEPSLGPSVVSEERLQKFIRWKIKFRPRDYLAKKTRSEAGAGGQVVEAKEDLNRTHDG